MSDLDERVAEGVEEEYLWEQNHGEGRTRPIADDTKTAKGKEEMAVWL